MVFHFFSRLSIFFQKHRKLKTSILKKETYVGTHLENFVYKFKEITDVLKKTKGPQVKTPWIERG